MEYPSKKNKITINHPANRRTKDNTNQKNLQSISGWGYAGNQGLNRSNTSYPQTTRPFKKNVRRNPNQQTVQRNAPQLVPGQNRRVLPEFFKADPYARDINFGFTNPSGDRIINKVIHKSDLIEERKSNLKNPEKNYRINKLKETITSEKNEKSGTDGTPPGSETVVDRIKKELDSYLAKKVEKKKTKPSPNRLMERVDKMRRMLSGVISVQKMKVYDDEWLKDDNFLVDCFLGLQVFNLGSATEYEALGLFHHNLNDKTSIFVCNPNADRIVGRIKRDVIPHINLDFGSVDQYAQTKISLPKKSGSFVKNFFGKDFFGGSVDTPEEAKPHSPRLLIQLEHSRSTFELKDDGMDLEKLALLDKQDILQLAGDKQFLTIFQKIWPRVKKKHLFTMLKKLRSDLFALSFSKNHSTFIYFLMKLDFSDIENSYMLYNDYYTNNYNIDSVGMVEGQYKSYEEYMSEVKRLIVREEFVQNYILRDFDSVFQNEISHRMFQKFLKDDILIERLKEDSCFQRLDFSSNVTSFIIDGPKTIHNSIFKVITTSKLSPQNLKLRIIPSKSHLLERTINFVNINFLDYKQSLQMTKTITTIIDFTEVKLVSFKEARVKERSVLIQRLKNQDKIYLTKLDSLIGYLDSRPLEILEKTQLNKSLTNLLLRMGDDFLLNFFFRVSSNLKVMISSRHCNYLVQEVMERLDLYLRGKKMKNVDLGAIEDQEIKALIGIEKTYSKKLNVIAFEVRKRIRDIFLLNFQKIMVQKYAKFVVCYLISNKDCSFYFSKDGCSIRDRYRSQEMFLDEVVEKTMEYYDNE